MTVVRARGRVERARWVVALALLGIAAAGILDPYSRWVAIACGLVFVPVAAGIVATLRTWVEVTDDAIAIRRARATMRVPWDEVTGYRFQQTQETRMWTGVSIHTRAAWRLHIESRGNPAIVIDHGQRRALIEAVLPRLHAALRERPRQTFGAFAVTDDVLRHSDQAVAWHEIESVCLDVELGVIVRKVNQSSPWARAPLHDVRCVLSLAELLAGHGVVVHVQGLPVPGGLAHELQERAAERAKMAALPVARARRGSVK